MRIALLTEGGYPYTRGESALWCDRLVRGLGSHDFEVYALSRGRRQEETGWFGGRTPPEQVRRVRTAPLWGEPPTFGAVDKDFQGTAAERFTRYFGELAEALCMPSPEFRVPHSGQRAQEDRFCNALYGLADLAVEHHGLPAALRSEEAVRILESAARAPGAPRAVRAARVGDLLAVTERLERALRVLSLDWYGPPRDSTVASVEGAGSNLGLAGVDLCHAVGGGLAALPGLLAKRAFGTPLLITEYRVRLREHCLESLPRLTAAGTTGSAGAGVRALLTSFQRQLTAEAYRRAEVITPGNTHARGWQEHCGADRRRLRTVYPGMDAAPFARVAEDRGVREPAPTLVWVGRFEPDKDVGTLLRAFVRVRRRLPTARLVLVEARPQARRTPAYAQEDGGRAVDYAADCRALAARLFPATATDTQGVGSAVVFAELGGPRVGTVADAYANASVVVRSSVVEGFPLSLVEAMFCGRATVSTDAGAVTEVVGGTGLVVPPSDPDALADACLALLTDPERRARLGAAARARAMELFTIEQNVTAFHGIYLELISRRPRLERAAPAEPSVAEVKPFMRTAESQVDGPLAEDRRTGDERAPVPPAAPSWARSKSGGGAGRATPVGTGAQRRGEVR